MRIKSFATFTTMAALVGSAAIARAQEMPPAAKPGAEHKLLEQFAGDWTAECEMPVPGGEPMVCKGTEHSRVMGGLWLVATGKSMTPGMEGESMITLGYDPAKKSYVGTFVCSVQDNMWEYTGKFDETGKKLILETEGPSMLEPGKTAKYQETLETVDADHKTFTSKIQTADGQWQQLMEMKYTRVK